MLPKTKKNSHFSDTAVIYHSRQDGCWIAHSLKTDQIGTGEQVVEALADLIRAVRSVLALARADQSIAYLRDAPPKIKAMAAKNKKLPHEIFEVAYRRATGRWPQNWTLPKPIDAAHSFTTRIAEDFHEKAEGVRF